MEVIFKAKDGKQFNDQYECLDYEFLLDHPALNEIKISSNDGKGLNILDKTTYENADVVVLTSDAQVAALKAWANKTGYCCYADCDSQGKWTFDYNGGGYVKND